MAGCDDCVHPFSLPSDVSQRKYNWDVALPEAPVPIWQNPTEFELFFNFVADRKPRRILEVGAFYGGTLWHWATRLKPDVLVSIDLPVHHESEHWQRVWECRATWASWMDNIEWHDLIGRSDDWFLHDEARKAGPFDFMFIDGDHSYEGVKRDFALYHPMLSEGGIVAFHDTRRHEPGVIQFAAELKELYPTVEFFSPDWGAGILVVLP